MKLELFASIVIGAAVGLSMAFVGDRALVRAVQTRAANVITPTLSVIDGDTIEWNNKRYRIRALAAPELNEPGGKRAKDTLTVLLKVEGLLECRPTGRETWGRLEADCTLRSTHNDVAFAMISAGVARHCPAYGRMDLADLPINESLPLPAYCVERAVLDDPSSTWKDGGPFNG